MRIATWNVNSLNTRLPQLLRWLADQAAAGQPVDLLGLQELKLGDDRFPHDALRQAGYEAAAFGQKTYNGVALLVRSGDGGPGPVQAVQRNIPGFADEQARVIAGTVALPGGEAMRVVNGYFVNGQQPGSQKFAYKLRWLAALTDWLRSEIAAHPNLVLLGDFNIAPEDRDSHDPEGLRGSIHHTDEERAAFRALLALGLHDAFRLFEQPERCFSWWDYRMLGFQKNRGLRIDHILVSDALRPRVAACTIDRAPRKWPQPSDHAPVAMVLR